MTRVCRLKGLSDRTDSLILSRARARRCELRISVTYTYKHSRAQVGLTGCAIISGRGRWVALGMGASRPKWEDRKWCVQVGK